MLKVCESCGNAANTEHKGHLLCFDCFREVAPEEIVDDGFDDTVEL